jgi:replicative DNA helicase
MSVLEAPPEALNQPHNLEAERAVLGGILLTDRALYSIVISEGLRPEHFYRPQHGVIYEAILALDQEQGRIDPLTVAERLRAIGRLEEVGGEAAIDALPGYAPAAGHVRDYARIVRENSLLRRLLSTTFRIQAGVANREGTPRELVEQAERELFDVADGEQRQAFRSISTVLEEELDKLHRLSLEKTSLTGVPSGFTELDRITGGFQPGNLVIVAARPAMGKSALVANIAEHAAIHHGKPVAMFSLEMAESELAQRFVASQASVKGDELRNGKISQSQWPAILKACQRLADAPMFVDDSSDISVTDIRGKARRLHQQHGGLGLIIVDYLQLLRADGRVENRVEQVGQMSRGLKILARELEVPVIALSQLSRNVEQRTGTNRRPVLADLRESGQIEQDADLVMFIYRQDYYDKLDGKESEREGEADIIVAKHRNGGVGEASLVFRPEFPRFMNKFAEAGRT